jgi:acetolactate synthase-1/2/3 large subunit
MKCMSNYAQQMCSIFEEQGVRCLFCVPGSPSIALFHAFERSAFKVVNSTSELNAAFMANGYSRACGETGVIVVIGGPGILEAIPGIAEAKADSVPLVIVVCHIDSSNGPRYKLHNLDHQTILKPLVKNVFDLKNSEDIGETLNQAFCEANSGEPGPVCVLVTPNILASSSNTGSDKKLRARRFRPKLESSQSENLAVLIRAAKKISIIAGAGTLESPLELRRLAESLGSPVITTLTARGILPEDHELSFYEDSSVGTPSVLNEIFDASDLILALGCKFSHNGCAGFTFRLPAEKLVHIDADQDVLAVHYPAALTICADVPMLINTILDMPYQAGQGWIAAELQDFRQRINLEEPKQLAYPAQILGQSPRVFFEALRAALEPKDLVVTDTGLHQSLARVFYEVLVPRGLIVPSDFQCMGYGIPAAIGARVAVEHRRVAAIIGDGAFLCSSMEIATAVNAGLQMSIFVFNDGHYGVIRLEQLRATGSAFGVDLPQLDYAAFAKAVGANYVRLEDLSAATMSSIVSANGVSIIEVNLTDNPLLDKFAHKAARKAALKRIITPALYGRLKRLFRH